MNDVLRTIIWYTLRCIFALFAWGTLIALLGALFSGAAQARPMTGGECIGLAKAAKQLTQFRDAHADIKAVKEAMSIASKKARTIEASYIKTDEDEQMMQDLVDLIFSKDAAGSDPDAIEAAVLHGCMKASAKANVRET